MAATEAELVAIQLPESQMEKRVYSEPIKWLSKKATAAWVSDMNYNGAAPSSADMFAKFVEKMGDDGRKGSDRAERRFCQRLRSQFDIRLGALKVQDPVTDAQVLDKAGR